MVACIVLAYFLSIKRGYYSDLVFDIVIICIPMAIIGARLYYVIFDIIDGGSWTFKKLIGLEGGLAGLAIYGGLIGAILGGLIVAALQKRHEPGRQVTFLQIADLGFATIMLGQAIGRWGNFANGEAYGLVINNPSLQWFPLAVNIDGVYHMATFFYESLWDLIGCGIMVWLYAGKRKSFDGFVLCAYGIWYGVGRAVIESWRMDSLWLVPGVIRVSQLLSILVVLAGLACILAHMYRARSKGLKPFIFVPLDQLDHTYYSYDKSQLSKPPMENKKKKKDAPDPADEVVLYEKLDEIEGDRLPDDTAPAEDTPEPAPGEQTSAAEPSSVPSDPDTEVEKEG